MLSTADDLLKFLSANLGFTQSSLRPLMEQMQVGRHHNQPEFGTTALPWYDWGVWSPPQSEILGHGGGTECFGTVRISNKPSASASTRIRRTRFRLPSGCDILAFTQSGGLTTTGDDSIDNSTRAGYRCR
jgi:hypothetical protein